MPKEPKEFSTEVIRDAAAGDAVAHEAVIAAVWQFVRMLARDNLDDRLRPTHQTSDLASMVLAKITPKKLAPVESRKHLQNLLREIARTKGIDLRRRLERDPQFGAEPIDAAPPQANREIGVALEALRNTPRRVADLHWAGKTRREVEMALGLTPSEYEAARGEIAEALSRVVGRDEPPAAAGGGGDGGD